MRELEELRFVERAAVFKRGRRAATLERRTNSVAFVYEEEYDGPPVATSLPLRERLVLTHAPGALPPFFSGLLPEGRRLTALRGAAKTSADDDFTLLLAVGRDTVGDVQIVPEGERVAEAEPLVTVSDWSTVRFVDLLTASLGAAGEVDRVALPGVQDKVSARMIQLPVAHADRRFILKLDPPEFPHLVANEAFFLDVGRRVGLPVAEAEIVHDSDGTPGLLVTRFDRTPLVDSDVASIAQEDGCQVLGRYPADKYRVSTEEVIEALAAVCRARAVAARALLQYFAFAYLTCNGDAHAKNFSVRHEAGEWRPTPMYDVPTSYVYGDYSMALTLNGKRKEDIGRADFVAVGEAVGVRAPAVESALDRLCRGVEEWIDDVSSLPFDEAVLRKLRRAIEYRLRRLA